METSINDLEYRSKRYVSCPLIMKLRGFQVEVESAFVTRKWLSIKLALSKEVVLLEVGIDVI